jgi:hypothetical protein
MAAIDASVALGLAGKAEQVFARDGRFLSFPLVPLPFNAAKLKALAVDPLSPEGQRGLSEFALLTNEIPDGPVWFPTGERRLWDIYSDILATAQLASGSRTEVEESDYQESHALLYLTAEDGTVSDSEVVIAYEQYRDAYLAAVQEFNNRKGQAELSTDAAVKAQWEVDREQLQTAVDEAEQTWVAQGRRTEVDDARRIVRELSSKSPAAVWIDHRKLFDPDTPEIFFRTNPDDGSTYLPTTYIPADIVDGAWPSIKVTDAELAALIAAAPEALKSRLGITGGSPVDWVEFEYAAITVRRSWFQPEVFLSRAWRFYDTNRILSDGGTPPKGECTAFVTELVLARNVKVQFRASASPVQLTTIQVAQLALPTVVARPYAPAALTERIAARRLAVADAVAAPELAPSAEPAAAAEPSAAAPAATRFARSSALRMAVRTTAAEGPVVATPVATPVMTALKPQSLAFRSARVAAALAPIIKSVRLPPKPPPEAEPTPTVSTTGSDFVFVLALVCKYLPKSPDPDETLTW